jgi:hypothetical protein
MMPIARIANFHWVRIVFGIEILRSPTFVRLCKTEWGSYQDMKAKVVDGHGGISDHLQSNQQCKNSIVVCNLQITNKLETFYVNRGKQGGRF